MNSDAENPTPENVFVCPVCRRRQATNKRYCDCPYCGEPMVPQAEWKRHQKEKGKQR